jgi:hypothetical protein
MVPGVALGRGGVMRWAGIEVAEGALVRVEPHPVRSNMTAEANDTAHALGFPPDICMVHSTVISCVHETLLHATAP